MERRNHEYISSILRKLFPSEDQENLVRWTSSLLTQRIHNEADLKSLCSNFEAFKVLDIPVGIFLRLQQQFIECSKAEKKKDTEAREGHWYEDAFVQDEITRDDNDSIEGNDVKDDVEWHSIPLCSDSSTLVRVASPQSGKTPLGRRKTTYNRQLKKELHDEVDNNTERCYLHYPRDLGDLQKLGQTIDNFVTLTYDCKHNFEVNLGEYNAIHDKSMVEVRNNKTEFIAKCPAASCLGEVSSYYHRSDGQWHVFKRVGHTCNPWDSDLRQHLKSSAYKPVLLGPLIQALVTENPTLLPKDLQNILQRKQYRKIDQSFVSRNLQAAIKKDFEDMDSYASKLPGLIECLEDIGHRAEMITTSAINVKERLLRISEYEHKEKEKKRKNQLPVAMRASFEPSPWDRDFYEAAISDIVEDSVTYITGWLFAPKPMIDNINHFIPISFVDGTHLIGRLNGVLLSCYGVDANRQMTCIAHGYFLDTENERTWQEFLSFICRVYPNYDHPLRRQFMDLQKGSVAAFSKIMDNALYFACCNHRRDNCVKLFGKDFAKIYADAVAAKSKSKLAEVLSRIPYTEKGKKFKQWVDLHPYSTQFSCLAGRTYGYTTESPAESMNNANKPARETNNIISLLLSLIGLEQRRWEQHRKDAHNCVYDIPPRQNEYVKRVTRHYANYNLNAITLQGNENIAAVPSYTNSKISYKTDLNSATCECNSPQIMGIPCGHIGSHALKISFAEPLLLYDQHLLTKAWKQQYPLETEYPVPTTASIANYKHVFNTQLRLVPAMPRKQGRPKKRGRQVGILERAAKVSKRARYSTEKESLSVTELPPPKPVPMNNALNLNVSRPVETRDRKCSNCQNKGHYASTCSALKRKG